MESFIEAGFDILNPVQWTAAGMDRGLIEAKYHERLVFWGGGVDKKDLSLRLAPRRWPKR